VHRIELNRREGYEVLTQQSDGFLNVIYSIIRFFITFSEQLGTGINEVITHQQK